MATIRLSKELLTNTTCSNKTFEAQYIVKIVKKFSYLQAVVYLCFKPGVTNIQEKLLLLSVLFIPPQGGHCSA